MLPFFFQDQVYVDFEIYPGIALWTGHDDRGDETIIWNRDVKKEFTASVCTLFIVFWNFSLLLFWAESEKTSL